MAEIAATHGLLSQSRSSSRAAVALRFDGALAVLAIFPFVLSLARLVRL
jgi:hypothetical protein